MNKEVRRSGALAPGSKLSSADNSGENIELKPVDQARNNLKEAVKLLFKNKSVTSPHSELVASLSARIKSKKLMLSLEDIERPQKLALEGDSVHLKLPVKMLQDRTASLDYVLNILIKTSSDLSKDDRQALIALIKTNDKVEQMSEDTISEDAILDIVKDLTLEERQELNRIQAERVAHEPEPEKPKESVPYALDTEYIKEISPRYTVANRDRNQAWQGKTAYNLDLAVNGGTDALAAVIAKMANSFLFLRSRELADKSKVVDLRDDIITDLVNNLAVYIAVQKNSDRSIHSKMLEAVSRLSQETLNPIFFRNEDFSAFKQEFTRKLSAADFSLQRSKDFTKAITGAKDDAPLLTSAVGESVARIGFANSGSTVAGYLGGTTQVTSSSGPSRDISIDPLVSELGIFPTAIPLIEKIGNELKNIDLQDLRAVQKIVPKEIFENLDKAVELEGERGGLKDDDPMKSLRPIEEYLKMLAVAVKHTPDYAKFLDKVGIKSPPVQFTVSQIMLAYYASKNDGELETVFREAINNLAKHSEFKDLNQFIEDQRNFVARRIDEAKVKDQEIRISNIRQKRIGKPGNSSEEGSGRAGLLALVRTALKNKTDLKDLKLFDSNPDNYRPTASGFLNRLGNLSDEDIVMLNSSLDEAKILMLYLVNGMKALGDLKLKKGLDDKIKTIPVLDPSEENPQNQFKELSLEELQKKFDKARVRVLTEFHPDRAARLFEDLTGKADEENSRVLAKQCHEWLSKADKIPEFGIGWEENYFGEQLNDIYRFVNETDLIEHVASEAAVVEPSRAKKLLNRLSSLEDRQGVLGSVLSSVTKIISKLSSLGEDDKKELNQHLKSLSA